MLTPGPDHPITLESGKRRWRARLNGHVIADSGDALVLREATLAPVVYFPRADVAMEYMGRSDRQTHCPYKGDAAYYTLTLDGEILENVAWSYEHPFDAMQAIAGRIAFYPGQVEVYEVDEDAVNPKHHDRRDEIRAAAREEAYDEIGEVIRHTDAGDGTSQRKHWPANVSMPQARDGGVR